MKIIPFSGKAGNDSEVTESIEYGGTAMEEEYWERFRATGSVADYLSYRDAVEQRNKEQQKVQGESYDGKYYSDRNDTVGTAYRGV